MNRMRIFLAIVSLALLSTLGACGTMGTKSQRLQLGMTKEQVSGLLGRKYTTVGARESTDSRRIEVLRYHDDRSGELLLYFRDGRLIQWGDGHILDKIPE